MIHRIISHNKKESFKWPNKTTRNRRLLLANRATDKMAILNHVITEHSNRKVHYLSQLDDFQFTKIEKVTDSGFETGPNDLDAIFVDSPTREERPIIIIDLESIDKDPKGLGNLNDVMDPLAPSYNGRPIHSDVDMYFIVSESLLRKPQIKEDFIDRLPGLEVDYDIDPSAMLNEVNSSNEFKESGQTLTVNFLEHLHWESAFPSLGINSKGQFSKLPDRLEGVHTLVLDNCPKNDPEFELFIARLKLGQYYFNGELKQTNVHVITSYSETGIVTLDRNIPKSDSGKTWIINPMTIDQAIDNAVFLGDENTRHVAIQPGFLNDISEGDEVIVEPGLSQHQRACLQEKISQLQVSFKITQQHQSLDPFESAIQSNDPECIVEQLKEQQHNDRPNTPLFHLNLSPQSDNRTLLLHLKPEVLEQGLFNFLEPEFIVTLKNGEDIVITGLEDNPELMMLLKPLWSDTPYIWHNGQRVPVTSNITCITTATDHPVDLHYYADKSGIPINCLSDIAECLNECEPNKPILTLSLCRMIHKQAQIQAGAGNAIAHHHWGQAINTAVLKQYRENPDTYRQLKEKVSQTFRLNQHKKMAASNVSSKTQDVIESKMKRRFRNVSQKHHQHRVNLILGPPSAGKSYLPEQLLAQDPYSEHKATVNFSPFDTTDTFWLRDTMQAWLKAGKLTDSDLEDLPKACIDNLVKDGILKPVADTTFEHQKDYYLVNTPPHDLEHTLKEFASRHNLDEETARQLLEILEPATKYFTAIVDEANLAPEGFWQEMLHFVKDSPPFITLGGQKIYVSAHHRLIMTGNNNMEGREAHHFLAQHCPVMFFNAMTLDEIKYVVVEPFLKKMCNDATTAKRLSKALMVKMEKLKKELPEHVFTPRDYLDVLEFYKQTNDLDEAILFSFESKLQKPRNTYPTEFETFFTRCCNSHKSLLLHTPSGAIKQHVFELWKQVGRISSIDDEYKGKRGHITLGPPSMGKDALLDMVIQEYGYESKVFRTSCKTTDIDAIKDDIIKAKKEGKIIILSELNLLKSSIAEGLLNDALTGKSAPGFFLFTTINPPDFSGRDTFSPAFLSRFGESFINPFSDMDTMAILTHKCGPRFAEFKDSLMKIVLYFDKQNQKEAHVPRITLRRVNQILAALKLQFTRASLEDTFKNACQASLGTHCYKLGKSFDQVWEESQSEPLPQPLLELETESDSLATEENIEWGPPVELIENEEDLKSVAPIESKNSSHSQEAVSEVNNTAGDRSDETDGVADVSDILPVSHDDITIQVQQQSATLHDLLADMITHYEHHNGKFVEYSFEINRASFTYKSFKNALKEMNFPKHQYKQFKAQYRHIKSKSVRSFTSDATKVAAIGSFIAVTSPGALAVGTGMFLVCASIEFSKALGRMSDTLKEELREAYSWYRSRKYRNSDQAHSIESKSTRGNHNDRPQEVRIPVFKGAYGLKSPTGTVPTFRARELSEMSYGTEWSKFPHNYDRLVVYDSVSNDGLIQKKTIFSPYLSDDRFVGSTVVLRSKWDKLYKVKNHFRNVIPLDLSSTPCKLATTLHHPEEELLMLHLPENVKVHKDTNNDLYLTSRIPGNVKIEFITRIPENKMHYVNYIFENLSPCQSQPEDLLSITDEIEKVLESVVENNASLKELRGTTLPFPEKLTRLLEFFHSFDAKGTLSEDKKSFLDLTKIILKEKVGVCFHRGLTAISLFRYFGIPCRTIHNQVHILIEFKANYKGDDSWFRLCLGGGEANTITESISSVRAKDKMLNDILNQDTIRISSLDEFEHRFIDSTLRFDFYEQHLRLFSLESKNYIRNLELLMESNIEDVKFYIEKKGLSLAVLNDLFQYFFVDKNNDHSNEVEDLLSKMFKKEMESIMSDPAPFTTYSTEDLSSGLPLADYLGLYFEELILKSLACAKENGHHDINRLFQDVISKGYLESHWHSIFHAIQTLGINLDSHHDMRRAVQSLVQELCFKHPLENEPMERLSTAAPDPSFNDRYPHLCHLDRRKKWSDISGRGQFRPERINQLEKSKLIETSSLTLNSIIFEAKLPLSRMTIVAINALREQCDANKVNLFMVIGTSIVHVTSPIGDTTILRRFIHPEDSQKELNLAEFVASTMPNISLWNERALKEWGRTELDPLYYFQKIIDNLNQSSKDVLEKLNLKTEWVKTAFKDSPEDITAGTILEKYLLESLTVSRFKDVFSKVSTFSNAQFQVILNAIKQIPDLDSRRDCSIEFMQYLIRSDNDISEFFSQFVNDREVSSLVITETHMQEAIKIKKERVGNNNFDWLDCLKQFPDLITERNPQKISEQIIAWFELQ